MIQRPSRLPYDPIQSFPSFENLENEDSNYDESYYKDHVKDFWFSYGVVMLAFFCDFLGSVANQASFAIQKVAHMEEEKRKQTGTSDE